MKISIDERIKNNNFEKKYTSVPINEALLFLEKLNGKEHTLLSFYREDGAVLMAGGGPQFYIINLTSKDSHYYSLKNIEEANFGIIELCAGGQHADFSKNIVISKYFAEAAIKKFYSHEEQLLQWIED